MENKNCESCGMPMNSIDDFGGKNPENKYCKHCTDSQGNLKSYSEKVVDFKKLLIKSKNLGEEQAEKKAKEILTKFKAWGNS